MNENTNEFFEEVHGNEYMVEDQETATNYYVDRDEEVAEFEEAEETKNFGEFLMGLIIGLALGTAGAGLVWWIERRKRLKVLDVFEEAICVAAANATGQKTATYNGKVIEIAEQIKANPFATMDFITTEYTSKVKWIGKKEGKRWQQMVKDIARLEYSQAEKATIAKLTFNQQQQQQEQQDKEILKENE